MLRKLINVFKSYTEDKPLRSKLMSVHSPLLALVLMAEMLMTIYKTRININQAK